MLGRAPNNVLAGAKRLLHRGHHHGSFLGNNVSTRPVCTVRRESRSHQKADEAPPRASTIDMTVATAIGTLSRGPGTRQERGLSESESPRVPRPPSKGGATGAKLPPDVVTPRPLAGPGGRHDASPHNTTQGDQQPHGRREHDDRNDTTGVRDLRALLTFAPPCSREFHVKAVSFHIRASVDEASRLRPPREVSWGLASWRPPRQMASLRS